MNSSNEKEMKKIFLYGVTVLAIGVLAAVNVTLGNGKKNALNDLQLANVEALATEEYSEPLAWSISFDCPTDHWWESAKHYHECVQNGPGNSCSTKGDLTCTCGTNC
jgi:hypothetical protein